MSNGQSFFLPAPGVMGNYIGSCIVCMRGTDTALAVRGEAEAGIAALMVLGVPEGEAHSTAAVFFAERYGSGEGEVPGGVIDFPIQVCAECCRKSGTGWKPSLLPEIPVYSHGGI